MTDTAVAPVLTEKTNIQTEEVDAKKSIQKSAKKIIEEIKVDEQDKENTEAVTKTDNVLKVQEEVVEEEKKQVVEEEKVEEEKKEEVVEEEKKEVTEEENKQEEAVLEKRECPTEVTEEVAEPEVEKKVIE